MVIRATVNPSGKPPLVNTDARIRKMQRELKQLEAERADRVRRGAPVPTWFDHMLDKRRTQLIDATRSVPINPPRLTFFQRIWRTLAP